MTDDTSKSKSSASTAAPAATTSADPFLNQLSAQLAPILATVRETSTGTMATALAAQFNALSTVKSVKVQPPHGDTGAECQNCKTDIADTCAQLSLDQSAAQTTQDKALAAAYASFETEIMTWQAALAQYNHARSTANTAMQKASDAAKAGFTSKDNPDSSACRIHYLYAGLQEAVAQAIKDYEVAAAAAAAQLSAGAADLMNAYTTYLSAVNAACADRLLATATAEQTFWLGIDQTRDAT